MSPVLFLLACAVLVCGLLLGGSGGSFADTVVQLLALPLIVFAGALWAQSPLRSPDRAALCILAGIVLLAFVQLMPLPISWWVALPGRAELFREMQSVGAAPSWPSLSLNPYATERALQWTLPCIAMFLAVRWMSQRQRCALLWLLFAGGIAMAVLGLALHGTSAEAAPTASELLARLNGFKPKTVSTASIYSDAYAGLFSNHNHFGTFIAMTLPLAAAMALLLWNNRRSTHPQIWMPRLGLLVLVMVTLLVAAFETRSRAAVILGALSIFGSLALLPGSRLGKRAVWSIAACAAAGVALTIVVAGSQTLARFDQGADIDSRWHIHAVTLEAARHFGPMGSGLGTFVEAYQTVAPEADITSYYINRAHGDYHELWLETGYPGGMLMAAFLVWYAWSGWLTWKQATRMSLLGRAATVSIALLLAHSYVDYPLRKTAILIELGLCCALLSVPLESTAGIPVKPSAPANVT